MYFSKLMLYRDKNATKGEFLVDIPSSLEKPGKISFEVRDKSSGFLVRNFYISIDGKKELKSYKVSLYLSQGTHKIVIEKPGYITYVKEVSVGGSQSIYLYLIIGVLVIIALAIGIKRFLTKKRKKEKP